MQPTTYQPGARVTVLGKHSGKVRYTHPDGSVAVRLDGETRVDLWHPSQVAL